ncbi:MAG: hypothetical protein V1706_15845 [Pseudomonadota bacterium]
MDKWYSLELGDRVESFSMTTKIQELFWPTHIACGSPKDMGAYSKYDPETDIVTAYFTPSAKPLADMFGANQCEQPSRDSLRFIAGPGSCLSIWPIGKSG